MTVSELYEKFKKNYPDLDEQGFIALVKADPTIVENSNGIFVGKYGTWIGNLFANGNIKLGDSPELQQSLKVYHKNKSHLPNLDKISTLDSLIELIYDCSEDFKPTRTLSKGEQSLEKVYEDDTWSIFIPRTWEASRKIGGDTHWCTASSSDYYFNNYNNKGPLYVNINKQTGEKYQFHFETSQFMDKDDRYCKMSDLLLTNGVIEYYMGVAKYFNLLMKYDSVKCIDDGDEVYEVGESEKYLMNLKEELLLPFAIGAVSEYGKVDGKRWVCIRDKDVTDNTSIYILDGARELYRGKNVDFYRNNDEAPNKDKNKEQRYIKIRYIQGVYKLFDVKTEKMIIDTPCYQLDFIADNLAIIDSDVLDQVKVIDLETGRVLLVADDIFYDNHTITVVTSTSDGKLKCDIIDVCELRR